MNRYFYETGGPKRSGEPSRCFYIYDRVIGHSQTSAIAKVWDVGLAERIVRALNKLHRDTQIDAAFAGRALDDELNTETFGPL